MENGMRWVGGGPASPPLARRGVGRAGREVLSRRITNVPATFLELLAAIGGESKVALEATYGWEWLAEPLEDVVYELRLAHPLRTKAIATARVKTDSVDARIILAHLLRPDLLPEAHLAQGGSSVARRPRAPSPRSTGSSGRR